MSKDQEREAFADLCSMLPADVSWGDPLTAEIASHIAASARAAMAPAGEPIDRADVLRLFAEYRSMMTQAVAEASQGNDITAGSLELAAEDAAGEMVRLLQGVAFERLLGHAVAGARK